MLKTQKTADSVESKNAALLYDSAKMLLNKKERIVIALDGRCAAGKTTLAAAFSSRSDCNVFHTDDFFLPKARQNERADAHGGNMDFERMKSEVLSSLGGDSITYRAFDCKTQSRRKAVTLKSKPITLIEGAYSCHPCLREAYDLCVFLDIDKEEQLRRLCIRNKDNLSDFIEKWIPLEEDYFAAYKVKENCDIKLNG